MKMKTLPRLALLSCLVSPGTLGAAPELLYANPGEDCSRQIRFSWHSASPECTLLCTAASDTSFAFARKVKCESQKTPVPFTGSDGYYRFTAEIGNLKPGTKYIYKVAARGDGESRVQSFETSPSGTRPFSVLWIGDIHTAEGSHGKVKSVNALVSAATKASAARRLSFVLCTGDAVKRGISYPCWREWNDCRASTDYMFAAIPGNKEYYGDKGKTRRHDRWFAAARNNPPNGAPGLSGTFWFIYGEVLFIGIDSLASEGVEMDAAARKGALERQRKWFSRTVASLRGRYRYLVAFQHYPYFKKSGPCDWGGFEKWNDLFDRCRVDLALCGDSHSYVRSRPLRDSEPSDDGTVYIVCPEIDSHLSRPQIAEGTDMIAAYDEKPASYGACVLDISPESIRVRYILDDGSVCDGITLKSRDKNGRRRK